MLGAARVLAEEALLRLGGVQQVPQGTLLLYIVLFHVMCWGKVELEWKEVTLWYLEMVRIPLSVTVIMSGFSMNGC